MLKNKTILITGGTGTLGYALTEHLLNNNYELKKLIIFSRDEQKQYNMALAFPENKYPQIRFFIGDVRDENRLKRALKNVDFIIHCAAMKHVTIAEYNPDECVKTNIGGAENIINTTLESGVSKIIALSTDKASSPINLYGATKLTSDKLFVAANNLSGDKNTSFCVVRYGNVMASNGSVIPFFLSQKKNKILPITDPEMTRFNISIEEGVELVMYALFNSIGGEIFVPKIPSYNIMDLANAICKKCEKKIIGIRPGEKLHEEMISSSDALNTIDIGKYFIILPNNKLKDTILKKHQNHKFVKKGFNYNSFDNPQKETIKTLISKIKNLSI